MNTNDYDDDMNEDYDDSDNDCFDDFDVDTNEVGLQASEQSKSKRSNTLSQMLIVVNIMLIMVILKKMMIQP